jgi:biopolymer transport protein ExbD
MTDVSLTPLIDTALTLLIIFMVATPMMRNSIRVTLPKGQAQEDNSKEQNLVVQISETKELQLNGEPVKSLDQLIAQLKKTVGAQQDRVVHVYGAKNVDYGFVIELVDSLKSVGGIRHVALATQRRAA